MSLDIIGPANAPNATTVRPSDTRAFGPVDSWVKDCTSASANDGTKLQAGLVNSILALLRGLIRGNGQTASSVDIVAQDNADDNMLLEATQHLIQRGLMKYAPDTSGAANQINVALSPALAEYKAGIEVDVLIANTNTGATNINVNSLGNVAAKTIMGADPDPGALPAGAMVKLKHDGSHFQIVSVLGAAAFRQPKASLSTSSVTGLSMGVYTAVPISNVSNDSLPVTITGGNTFSLPAGTYVFVVSNSMRIVVNNQTEIAESMRLLKNGSTVIGIDFELSYLLAGQDLSAYHGFCAVATVTGTDTIQLQGETGTTASGDFNLGQINAGSLYIVRIGP